MSIEFLIYYDHYISDKDGNKPIKTTSAEAEE